MTPVIRLYGELIKINYGIQFSIDLVDPILNDEIYKSFN
jgi:hypothetical protein